MADLVGKTFGAYRLEAALGKGGMATVYRAYQTAVKRYVAIKVMAADIASDPGFVERFTREAEVIAALQHPHILPIIDYGEAEGLHYLVMQYLEGGSLEDRMRKRPLTLPEAGHFLDQIASALDYAHKRGVVHRDFKASNVLLDNDDNAYLTDFGIARLAGSSTKLTATGTVMGTPAYMSPEQAMGRPVDGRTDIYALGVVTYEMVVRRLPFIADTPAALIFQHVYEAPPPPSQINALIPTEIENVIMRALEKNPDSRYQTAGDMAREFNEALRTSGADAGAAVAMDSTLIGGPLTPVITPPRSTPAPRAMPSRITQAPTKAESGRALAPAVQTVPTSRGGRVPPVLIIVGVLVLLVLLGGGGGLLLVQKNNQDNTNATSTQQAIQQALAASTQVALVLTETAAPTNTPSVTLAPSNTLTPSLTPTFTATLTPSKTDTPTLTLTPSHTNTPTPTLAPSNTLSPTATLTPSHTLSPTATNTALPTNTPNATLTAVVQQMVTVAAFQTQIAQATQTAIKQATIAQGNAAHATATEAANATASQVAADFEASATADSENNDATSTAIAASVVPPTDTPEVSTDTPVPGPDAPDTVIPDLANNGFLTTTDGQQVVSLPDVSQTPTGANFINWRTPDGPSPEGDFVMYAEVSWDNSHSDDGCGFLFRYSETGTNQYAFHSVYLTPAGRVLALTHVTNKNDVSITNVFNNAIKTGATADNKLLLIGQGNNYRVYVNAGGWKRIANFTPRTQLADGSVTVAGQSGSSSGLTCHFANFWVWQLTGGSGGNSTPQVDLASGLTSGNPNTVISALEQAQLIPAGVAQQVQQSASQILKLTTFAKGQGGQFAPLTNLAVANFVLSVDVTMNISEQNSVCAVYYNATNAPASWVVIFFYQNQGYALYTRKNGQWNTNTATSGNSPLIQIGSSPQRLTLVVLNSKGSVYLNGQLAFTFEDHTFDANNGGGVGYYMEKLNSDSKQETCTYTNATLWQLP